MTALLPPHPAPHGPIWASVPPGAWDTHCHIFGPAERFPYAADAPYRPAEAPFEFYRKTADVLGLERSVFVQPAAYRSDHTALLDAIARDRGRYAGVAIVDDRSDLVALDAGGIRGARLNFVGHLGQRPPADQVQQLRDRVAPLGWHLVFHLDGPALVDLAGLIARLGCDVVIDHMARPVAAEGLGQPGFAALLDLLRAQHVWAKISAGDRMVSAGGLADAAPFMAAVAEAAPDRTLWGTDWPHPNVRWMPDDGDLIDLLALAVPDAVRREAILVANPARLYRFT